MPTPAEMLRGLLILKIDRTAKLLAEAGLPPVPSSLSSRPTFQMQPVEPGGAGFSSGKDEGCVINGVTIVRLRLRS